MKRILCLVVLLCVPVVSVEAAPRRPVLRAAAAVVRVPAQVVRGIRQRKPVRRLVGRVVVQPIRAACSHCR